VFLITAALLLANLVWVYLPVPEYVEEREQHAAVIRNTSASERRGDRTAGERPPSNCRETRRRRHADTVPRSPRVHAADSAFEVGRMPPTNTPDGRTARTTNVQ